VSINYEPKYKLKTPDDLKIARYQRRHGHEGEGPSFNFAITTQPIIMFSGWCCGNSSTHARTCVVHNEAICWVEWGDGTLPKGVHYGAHISIIGLLKTYNTGAGFDICQACLLDKSPQAMITAAIEHYPEAVLPPRGKEIRRRKPRKINVNSPKHTAATDPDVAEKNKSCSPETGSAPTATPSSIPTTMASPPVQPAAAAPNGCRVADISDPNIRRAATAHLEAWLKTTA
jgi:hypothetical protein